MLKVVLFCLLTAGGPEAAEGRDTLRLMFWNVENFFAPGDFSGRSWSKGRFYTKCNAVAKTLLLSADTFGGLSDIVGFAEVGDASVLKALLYSTPLRKLDYSFVHYDSPDRRGIDCALLYRRGSLRLVGSEACHLYDSSGRVLPTRDILLTVFEMRCGPFAVVSGGGDASGAGEDSLPEKMAVLVNHHPSKVGAESEGRRRIAMQRMLSLADSLRREGIRKIIAVGDFNDSVVPAVGLNSRHLKRKPWEPPGTIKFQGRWERIDGCPLLEGLRAEEHIFAPQQLLQRDSYGGEKPRRTFSGPRYLGGVSDHLPVFYLLVAEN